MSEKEKEPVDLGFILVLTSHALNHIYDTLLPVLYPSIISELGLSYSLVGLLVMGYRLSSGLLQIIMGFLGRFVRRKILLGVGMIWQSLMNFSISISNGFNNIFISRSLSGIGASSQHPTGSAYIAEKFSRDQVGRAMGLNITAAQIGRFIAPFLGTLLLPVLGWRTTILVFSVPGLLIGVAFLFIAESKRLGDSSGHSSLTLLFNGLREVFLNRTVLTVIILETVLAFRAGAASFIPTHLIRSVGIPSLEAGILFTIFLGSGLPSPYFWGYLSDRFERRKIIMFVMGVACILWYLLPYGRNIFQCLVILVPLGFVCQGIGGQIQAYVAVSTTEENRDLIYGIYFTLSYGLGSLSPVIQGYLADSYGFQASFSYVALISIFAVAAAYFLKQKQE